MTSEPSLNKYNGRFLTTGISQTYSQGLGFREEDIQKQEAVCLWFWVTAFTLGLICSTTEILLPLSLKTWRNSFHCNFTVPLERFCKQMLSFPMSAKKRRLVKCCFSTAAAMSNSVEIVRCHWNLGFWQWNLERYSELCFRLKKHANMTAHANAAFQTNKTVCLVSFMWI